MGCSEKIKISFSLFWNDLSAGELSPWQAPVTILLEKGQYNVKDFAEYRAKIYTLSIYSSLLYLLINTSSSMHPYSLFFYFKEYCYKRSVYSL